MVAKTDIIQFRIDPVSMAQLTALSSTQHQSISELVRSWILQRLREELITANSNRRIWQNERLAEIKQSLGNDFVSGPALVIHAFPLTPNQKIDTTSPIFRQISTLQQTHFLPIESRINRHGYYSESTHHGKVVARSQIFKTGQIECVRQIETNGQNILGLMVDNDIVMSTLLYMGILVGQQIPLPYLFSVSLVGIKGYSLVSNPESLQWQLPRVDFQEDEFTLPDVIIDKIMPAGDCQGMAELYRPVLDEFWQASGHQYAYSFDTSGKWHGPW